MSEHAHNFPVACTPLKTPGIDPYRRTCVLQDGQWDGLCYFLALNFWPWCLVSLKWNGFICEQFGLRSSVPKDLLNKVSGSHNTADIY